MKRKVMKMKTPNSLEPRCFFLLLALVETFFLLTTSQTNGSSWSWWSANNEKNSTKSGTSINSTSLLDHNNGTTIHPTIKLNLMPLQSDDFQKTGITAKQLSEEQLNQIVINPSDIQFTAPDASKDIESLIINQIRQQLGNKPITLGELKNRNISFTAELPGIKVNRTVQTNTEETLMHRRNNLAYIKPYNSTESMEFYPTEILVVRLPTPPTYQKILSPSPPSFPPSYSPPPPPPPASPPQLFYASNMQQPISVSHYQTAAAAAGETSSNYQNSAQHYNTNGGYATKKFFPTHQTASNSYQPTSPTPNQCENKKQTTVYRYIEVCNGKQIQYACNHPLKYDSSIAQTMKQYDDLYSTISQLKNFLNHGGHEGTTQNQMSYVHSTLEKSLAKVDQLKSLVKHYDNMIPSMTGYAKNLVSDFGSIHDAKASSPYQPPLTLQHSPQPNYAASNNAGYQNRKTLAQGVYSSNNQPLAPPSLPLPPVYSGLETNVAPGSNYDGNQVKITYNNVEETFKTLTDQTNQKTNLKQSVY